MKFISNYGHLYGPNHDEECRPEYLREAIDGGFYVLVDVFCINDDIFIGSQLNGPLYLIDIEFLKNKFILCKPYNYKTMEILSGHNDITIYSENKDDICSDFIAYVYQKTNAKVKHAIIISGTCRRYKENFKEQIKKYRNQNPDKWVDVFVSLNSDQYDLEFYNDIWPCAYIYELFTNKINTDVYENQNLRLEYTEAKYKWSSIYDNDEPDILKNNKIFGNHVHRITSPFIRVVPRFDVIRNFLSMYYNQNKAFNLICDRPEVYKTVMIFRTDIVSNELPNIDAELEQNTVYFPRKHIFHPGWINNAIVYGHPHVMKIYCNLYNCINFKDDLLHSEILITEHLKKENVKFKIIDYEYDLDPER